MTNTTTNTTSSPPTSEASLHVVLGAGQIGTRLRDILLARGQRVRSVRLSPVSASTTPGLEHVSGDLTDLAFAERATRGAAVVYDCMNPLYHRWPALLLPTARGALHGAAKAGAKLVALDSLYMYGRPSGPMREDTPVNPCSRKGALRATLAEMRLAAHAKGDVKVTIGRASDFFGANLPNSFFSERFFKRIYAGKAGECTGDPDMPHAYTYADDVAAALAMLGADARADGQVWHLPTNPAESTRALVARFGKALGLETDVKRLPTWLLRSLGIFSPLMRELVEMTYQWEVPFELDDSRFRSTFGMAPTPLDEAVAQTAAWARSRFGPRT